MIAVGPNTPPPINPYFGNLGNVRNILRNLGIRLPQIPGFPVAIGGGPVMRTMAIPENGGGPIMQTMAIPENPTFHG